MGLLRLVLAISVIAGHADTTAFGITWVSKFYAVQAFFVISGFYMAMIVTEKYYAFPISAFYRSRVLRIFPGYIVGLILMLIVSSSEIRDTFFSLTRLARASFVVENAVILGQDMAYVFCFHTKAGSCVSPVSFTINPPAWSLSVELVFYLVAPFIVRWPQRILMLVAVGTVYHLIINLINFQEARVVPFAVLDGDSFRYYFYPASFMFFGAGALSYHLKNVTITYSYVLVIALFVAFSCIETLMPTWHLIIFAVAIPELFRLTKNNQVDRIIGEFSYPVYILHWPILTWLKHHISGEEWISRYLSIGSMAALLSCLAGAVLYVTVDRHLTRYRHPSPNKEEITAARPAFARSACLAYFGIPFAVLAAFVR